MVGSKIWVALLLAVPFRLRLGGEVTAQCDLPLSPLPLITRVVGVRACARSGGLLVGVDELAS